MSIFHSFAIWDAKSLKLNISKLLRTQTEPYNSKETGLHFIINSRTRLVAAVSAKLFPKLALEERPKATEGVEGVLQILFKGINRNAAYLTRSRGFETHLLRICYLTGMKMQLSLTLDRSEINNCVQVINN